MVRYIDLVKVLEYDAVNGHLILKVIYKDGRDPLASQRQLRVGEEVRHVLSLTISINDWPVGELQTPVTVTQVNMSPDLQKALVFVMPLGGLYQEETIAFLTEMSPYMRKKLADSMSLRRVPMLRFVIDETFDKAEKMENLFKAIKPSPKKED